MSLLDDFEQQSRVIILGEAGRSLESLIDSVDELQLELEKHWSPSDAERPQLRLRASTLKLMLCRLKNEPIETCEPHALEILFFATTDERRAATTLIGFAAYCIENQDAKCAIRFLECVLRCVDWPEKGDAATRSYCSTIQKLLAQAHLLHDK